MLALRSHLARTTLLVLVVGQPAVAQDDHGATSYTSDDGLATLALPSSAVPEGTDIAIWYRSGAEAPPDLSELTAGGSPSHYLIEPTDITFDPPARLIREVPLTMLERSAEDPQVLGMLAIRDSTGGWSWASDLGFEIDAATGSLEISGDIAGGGQVFAFGAGVIWPGVVGVRGYTFEDLLMTESFFYVQSFLGLPTTYEGHDAVITDAAGVTGDPGIATAGEALVTDVDGDPFVNLPFRCVSPGQTTTGLTFTLDGVGDDILLATWLGLPATAVEVGQVGSIECLE